MSYNQKIVSLNTSDDTNLQEIEDFKYLGALM